MTISASSQGRHAEISCVWFFMNTTLAARFPFEMLDDVGDVSLRAINVSFFECIVKQTTCWANKGFALEVFFITWLFADEENFSATRAFAKDRLRATLPEVAGFAVGSGVTKRFKRFLLRKEFFRRSG
jgi:hypothetical protein